jgi:hypothetical protein
MLKRARKYLEEEEAETITSEVIQRRGRDTNTCHLQHNLFESSFSISCISLLLSMKYNLLDFDVSEMLEVEVGGSEHEAMLKKERKSKHKYLKRQIV